MRRDLSAGALAAGIAAASYQCEDGLIRATLGQLGAAVGLGVRAIRSGIAELEQAALAERSAAGIRLHPCPLVDGPGAGLADPLVCLGELRALRAKHAAPTAIRVWVLMHGARHRETGAVCWHSETIAEAVGCCVESVRRAMERLREVGAIAVRSRAFIRQLVPQA
ncbi:MAG: helix-turn-helix domain-containing protein, partial [Mycobacterium sp.]|nr:helix-turn-helix domain-containing protein [Mycobacterium sp.]